MNSYGDVPFHLDYIKTTMSGALLDTAGRDADFTALYFMGRSISFRELAVEVEKTAKAFWNMGIRPGVRVMVCMPNVPQAIYCLYGLNRIGAVATMVHPLSAVGEISYYMDDVDCDYALTLDQFYDKFVEVNEKHPVKKLVIARISDALPCIKSLAYRFMTERKFTKVRVSDNVLMWNDFIKGGESVTGNYVADKDPYTEAVVLFSGGTTGINKGIMLSDYNFNALAQQTAAMSHETIRHSRMLAAMPVFHGFGLGVCIHTMMVAGGTSILVPRFNAKSYADLIKKHRPNFIAGVPTLFEAITRCPNLDGVDLSCLKGVFSGGDSLTVDLKKKFDAFLASHNAGVRVREGYGTTECVTASCLTPYNKEKEGSIGLPYPDTYFQICAVGTCDEVPYGSEGEICICGPTVMLGYINHEAENASTLKVHADGNVWLHTGDLGLMDEEGFVYFRQRIKRMIITNGYNVYPSQLENVFDSHPAVQRSCVIGVADPMKMQRVKAFIVLEPGYEHGEEMKQELLDYCSKHVAKYAMPKELEFRDSLPTTLVGKVAYTKLS